MDLNAISTLISGVGFPCAMCVLLLWYMQKESEEHHSETAALKDAVNELKIAITTLTERLNHDNR